MSLLMDALKKAEQEKKEAAKRLKHTGPNPIADTGEHQVQVPGDLENTGPNEMTVSQEMDLSLEPIDAGQAESLSDYTDEYPSGENTTEMEVAGDMAADEVSEELPIHENTQEMTAELPPVMDRGAAEVDLDFDNTLDEMVDGQSFPSPFAENEYGFDETLDSVTASQLAADIGGGPGQPTPVAANTVFEAGRNSKWVQGSRWALAGICVMAVLVAGAIVVQYQTTPTVRDIPKPVALPAEIQAQQAALAALPKPTLPPDPMTAQEVTGEVAESLGADTSVAEETTAATDEQAGMDMPATQVEEEAPADLPPVEDLVGSESVADTTENLEEKKEITPQKETEPEPAIAMQEEPIVTDVMKEEFFEPIVPARPVTPELIRISRSKTRDGSVDNNQSAYRAYQSGNLAQAESLYKATLAKTPGNRDALLGLAAIKLRQNDKAAAFLVYRKLLQLNPGDPVARLALLNLQRRANPVYDESTLKLMLAEQPDSPHLYFSLGTLYAGQLKWADAQRAFFEAFARDSNNPDYALNLAVSLDHMGQLRAARNYYQKAVELADTNPASFTVSDVLQRIKTIGQAQSS